MDIDTLPFGSDATIPQPLEADDDRELRARQLEAILLHVSTASLISTAFALVLSIYLAPVFGLLATQVWLAVKFITALPRIALGHAFRRGSLRFSPERTRSLLLVSLAIDGAVWGAAGVWGAHESTETTITLVACLLSVAAIAALGLQIEVMATAAFVYPIGIPLAFALLARGDGLGIFGACAAALVAVQSTIAAANSERRLKQEIIGRRRWAAALTERAAIAEERARVTAMREVVVARSAFLAKVSHELRSPIQGIVSALDVLEMRRDQPVAESEELVHRIRRSSLLLNVQLRDLLTLAKGEAGQLAVHPEVFEANSLVEAMGDAAAELASAKDLSVRITVPPEPAFVVADGSRIDQILTNLVVNAIRNTQRGEVRVTLKPFSAEKRKLSFEVADTGPGMPAEVLQMLRDAEPLTTLVDRRGEGSGLGLAIVRTLVDLLGGTLAVAQSRSTGCVVAFEVPAEAAVPDEASTSVHGDSGRLLIVDDREDIRDALALVADELGYECDVAGSTPVAANLLAARRYDAVLLDIEMPIRGGVDTAAEARSSGPNRGARFIGMSAGEPPKSVRGSFDAWLTKPISRAALRQALGLSVPDTGFRPSQPGLWADDEAFADGVSRTKEWPGSPDRR